MAHVGLLLGKIQIRERCPQFLVLGVEEALDLRSGHEIGIPIVAFQIGGPLFAPDRLGEFGAPECDLRRAEVFRPLCVPKISSDDDFDFGR